MPVLLQQERIVWYFERFTILMLGLDNGGKTTILKALSKQDITNISPTKGFNIKNLSLQGVKLNVWDIGGQKQIREYWSNYFQGTSALCYVVDSSDVKRLDQARQQLKKLLQQKQLQKVPVLVFANKQDILTSLTADQISKRLGLSQIKNHDWSIIACSAKTQDGLQEGMQWVVQKLK